jgi:hypothetical protein
MEEYEASSLLVTKVKHDQDTREAVAFLQTRSLDGSKASSLTGLVIIATTVCYVVNDISVVTTLQVTSYTCHCHLSYNLVNIYYLYSVICLTDLLQ